MDFAFTPAQDAAAGLAARILGDRATPARMSAVEAQGDRFDAELWRELGAAGLLSLAVPQAYGGAGLGLLELARVVVEVGRRVAPVPLAGHGAAALVLAEHASAAQRDRWLPGAGTGELVLAPAVAEPLAHAPERPSVTAGTDPNGLVLDGTKTLVRAAGRAAAFLVTASGDDGTVLVLVPRDAPGLTVQPQRLGDGDATGLLTLDRVRLPSSALVGAGPASADRLVALATVLACAEQWGVTQGALRLTASYAASREQFGRPIGTFQAVSQRLADGYIDVLGQELTLWQAAWRLAEGLPARTELASAKLFAADAGHRVAHTTVHVHGGVGIDLDGEAHRYFTAAKRHELAYGGATEQAIRIGRALGDQATAGG